MSNLQQILNLPSTAHTANSDTGVLNVGAVSGIAFDANVSAITGTGSPSVTFYIDRQGLDGAWYNIYASSAVTAIGTVSASVGQGFATAAHIGSNIRIRWVLAGTTPSATFTISVIGK